MILGFQKNWETYTGPKNRDLIDLQLSKQENI